MADFTGRSDQVALVRALLCGTAALRPAPVVVSAVVGKAGVGKTALAIHVAHQVREVFPDGQLYVNLHGAEPQPLEAAAVLARFLRSLGVDGAMIPVDQDEREALYRACLAARPHWSLGQLASLLADERGRLDELAAGDLEVRASLALSYEALSGEQQRAFRLLGMLGVGDLPAWVAGPLLRIGHQQAERLVEQLVDAQLLDLAAVDPTGAARYRFHDLVRIYAKERASAYDSAETWRAAVGRVTAGWLALAEQADARLPGVSDVITTDGAARWLLPAELVDQWLADPLAWFERERTNLVAAVEEAAANGLEEAAWELAGCLTSFFLMRSYWLDWDHVQEVVLTACRQAGNRRGEAAALTAIGYAMAVERLNDHPGDGQDRLSRAIELFRELGDRRGEAKALHALAEFLKRIGISQSPAALQAAVDYATQSLHLAHLIGDLSLQADALLTLGGAYRYLRQPAEAIPALEEARRLRLLLGARHGQAMTLWHLAMAARDAGNPRAAGALLEQSLNLVRELEDRRGQARLLLDLGQVRTDEGRLGEADELLAAALAAWPTHTEDYSFRAKALDALGRLRCRQGRYDQAADHFAEAASRWGDLSADAARDESLEALGDVLTAAGCSQEARRGRVNQER